MNTFFVFSCALIMERNVNPNRSIDRSAFLLYEIVQYSAVRKWRNVMNRAPTADASVLSLLHNQKKTVRTLLIDLW